VSEPTETKKLATEEITFTTFVLSLSASALQQLGVEMEEGLPKSEVNLVLAKQSIDILEMLDQKTQGNLSDEESHLLHALLYDLRMRYVQAAGGAKG
jgi:hypothetical protein